MSENLIPVKASSLPEYVGDLGNVYAIGYRNDVNPKVSVKFKIPVGLGNGNLNDALITAEYIISKLGYTPEEVIETNENGYYIIDTNKRICLQITSDGFDVAKISPSFLSKIETQLSKEIIDVSQAGYFILDSLGKIGLQITADGFDVAKLSASFLSKVGSAVSTSTISDWKGKLIGYLGDSITFFGLYVNALSNLQVSSPVNYGVGGTTISLASTTDTTSFVTRYLDMRNDLDMVVVFGGTNDWGHSSGIFGVFTDRTNTTFYGAIHLLIQGLLTKYPQKPIVFVTPLHRADEFDPVTFVRRTNNSTGKTLLDYVNAIKEVTAFYSIPVIDAYSESGLDAIVNNAAFFADGLHPTTFGSKKLASYFYLKLEKIYKEYYVLNK